jgi:hypothetical protein
MPLEFGVFQGASVGPRPWDVTEPLRIRHHRLDFLDAAQHGAERNELAMGSLGNNAR